jgi:hypothetical protein
MNRHMESLLAKALQQWVARHHPPADGRERLLQKAATPQPQSPNKFALSWLTGQGAFRLDILGTEIPRRLTGWLYFSFQPGYGNLSVV